ncbi:MAG: hypothetical protein EOP85_01230 [Verrucomicrobiaceae bacterium]|nr:MAG: hypothetical protein EOP85_01230 [Verrucomicrobiaceae bacterium]
MKTPTILLSVTGLAFGTLLTSCVDPYAQPPTQTVTHYHTGYEVRTLPRGYRTEYYSGTPYYVYEGTYYRPRSGRYVVVEAPRRDGPRQRDNRYYNRSPRSTQITKLPPGHRVVRYRGTDYYQVQDTYYERRGPNYIVVKRPY